ncbi:hypothetical protein [Algoriphagus sp.]|uniref:hypothetical protein n=1 Tax=Algoriphagus sp. TaxID=1872435 RepID=UPI0025FB3B26|nr:hypothetical protein [Algoriphagus sp.]
MKNIIICFSFCFLLVACGEDEKPKESIIGTWELVGIYNPWIGETSDSDVDRFFQTYQFMSNGTFKKTRIYEEDGLKEASGTFTVEDVPAYSSSDAKLYVILIFTDGDNIFNNCGQPNEEQLTLRFNNQLNNFSATPCDGPGYIFEKK